ncbi:hypothetical protein AB0L65_26525 [Nonomuraea sp. NPDC052116]|uniref:hypothetical protein n=1 Tax=Nonomuraea sp. NPDC052116 TaxID=3155665 RepID=UPI00343B013C
MNRMIVGAVVSAMTMLIATTPAQAASADPVKALQGKLKVGKGVKFTDVTSLLQDSEKITFLRRSGKWQFGKKGIAASDITTDYNKHTGGIFDYMYSLSGGRTIWVDGKSWTTHPMYGEVPNGKKYLVDPLRMTGSYIGTFSQLVNPAEPATLKVLLKGKKQGRTYSGKLTYAALAKASPWFRASSPLSEGDKTVVEYRLMLGPDNLPRKLLTSHLASSHVADGVEVGDGRFSTETSYSGWGSKVSVSAPPKSQVAG